MAVLPADDRRPGQEGHNVRTGRDGFDPKEVVPQRAAAGFHYIGKRASRQPGGGVLSLKVLDIEVALYGAPRSSMCRCRTPGQAAASRPFGGLRSRHEPGIWRISLRVYVLQGPVERLPPAFQFLNSVSSSSQA